MGRPRRGMGLGEVVEQNPTDPNWGLSPTDPNWGSSSAPPPAPPPWEQLSNLVHASDPQTRAAGEGLVKSLTSAQRDEFAKFQEAHPTRTVPVALPDSLSGAMITYPPAVEA